MPSSLAAKRIHAGVRGLRERVSDAAGRDILVFMAAARRRTASPKDRKMK